MIAAYGEKLGLPDFLHGLVVLAHGSEGHGRMLLEGRRGGRLAERGRHRFVRGRLPVEALVARLVLGTRVAMRRIERADGGPIVFPVP